MSLVAFFDGVEPPGIIIFSSVILGLILVFVLIIYVHIMYPFLSKRLDSLLFHTPWFSEAELIMYSHWPLSHIRVMQYMYFITFPNFLRKRRFKGMNKALNLPTALVVASKIYMTLHLIAVILGITFAVTGFYTYFFYEAPTN